MRRFFQPFRKLVNQVPLITFYSLIRLNHALQSTHDLFLFLRRRQFRDHLTIQLILFFFATGDRRYGFNSSNSCFSRSNFLENFLKILISDCEISPSAQAIVVRTLRKVIFLNFDIAFSPIETVQPNPAPTRRWR